LQVAIEDMASEGDSVFVHWHMTGTFSGASLRGISATGRPFDIRGTDYFSFRGGEIVSVFVAYDGLDLATQLGLLPPPGP
jgi:predicted ester cyclase